MTMSTFLQPLESQENASEAFCEYVVDRLELSMQSVAAIIWLLQSQNPPSETASLYSTLLCELLECLRSIYHQWSTYPDHCMHGYTTNTSYRAPLTYIGDVGRPKFLVTQHQLQYLRSMSFSWIKISQILSISTMMLYRRRQDYGMLGEPNGTLTDSELQSVIMQLQSDMPALGQTTVWGRLRLMGFLSLVKEYLSIQLTRLRQLLGGEANRGLLRVHSRRPKLHAHVQNNSLMCR